MLLACFFYMLVLLLLSSTNVVVDFGCLLVAGHCAVRGGVPGSAGGVREDGALEGVYRDAGEDARQRRNPEGMYCTWTDNIVP